MVSRTSRSMERRPSAPGVLGPSRHLPGFASSTERAGWFRSVMSNRVRRGIRDRSGGASASPLGVTDPASPGPPAGWIGLKFSIETPERKGGRHP